MTANRVNNPTIINIELIISNAPVKPAQNTGGSMPSFAKRPLPSISGNINF